MTVYVDFEEISGGEFSTLTQAVKCLLEHDGVGTGMYSDRALETATVELRSRVKRTLREQGYADVIVGHRSICIASDQIRSVGAYDDFATAAYQALVDLHYSDVIAEPSGYVL